MNVTAVHTGTGLPSTRYGLYRHSPWIVCTTLSSYAGKPDDLSFVTAATEPSTLMHSLNELMNLSLPERAISVFVLSSGTISFVPATRCASSNVGGTLVGARGGGGIGGGGPTSACAV